ncbi:MAG: hypothetical protein WBF69_09065 [Castellaniella sp.]|uniref:hypothetical protein n=1 Tax=Castellaniella sp. TaxID=1955812 RepID=UPI003C72748B
MGLINLTLLVREDWRDRYPVVLERCRQAGLNVERELTTVGAIAGNIEEDRLSALKDIEGVSAIEPERLSRGLE